MTSLHEIDFEASKQPSVYYKAIYDNWSRLLSENPEPLYGDEAAWDPNVDMGSATEETAGQITGIRRIMDFQGGQLSLVRYDSAYRFRMAELLRGRPDVQTVTNPLGHIQFAKYLHGAALNGALYLEEDGLKAFVECSIEGDEVQSDDSRACYSFAKQIGVGESWVNAMYEAGEPAYHHIENPEFDEVAQLQLVNSLESLT